jgi:hypothetical protein
MPIGRDQQAVVAAARGERVKAMVEPGGTVWPWSDHVPEVIAR